MSLSTPVLSSTNTVNEHDRHTPPRSRTTDSSPVALMQISANVVFIFRVCLSSTEISIKLHIRATRSCNVAKRKVNKMSVYANYSAYKH